MMPAANVDILVIGGGINGTGIACDAAGRGLKVMLCEANDLASATSSASSKLIHGGLRYLEHYEFRLVREALAEREVLLRRAPHIIWPLRFVLPHQQHLRPKWMIRAGLWIYDNLYRRKLIPASRAINLKKLPSAAALNEKLRDGFAYWDCWADDARLVVANARAAHEAGAEILTRTRFVSTEARGGRWLARLADQDGGPERIVDTKVIVNAAGPWVDAVGRAICSAHDAGTSNQARLRLVKGSHIVVPRIMDGDDAFILQNEDERVIFVLPYEGDFSLIGTTDIDYEGTLDAISISEDEIAYLLESIRPYFRMRPGREDVVWSFSGVRPLYDDHQNNASQVTRDYRLELLQPERGGPVLSVLGGKITTYRRLAEEAMSKLGTFFPDCGPDFRKSWTHNAKLPGGELGCDNFETFLAALASRKSGFDIDLLRRLARRHGANVEVILSDAKTVSDLGTHIGHDLYEREVDYLKRHEWARTPEDILWRRTKVGLHLAPQEYARAQKLLDTML